MNSVLNDSKPSDIDYLIESIKASKTNCSNQSFAIKFPCRLCTHKVKHNDKAIFCTSCLSWVHIKCNGITIDEYKFRMRRNCENPELVESEEWVCLNCTIAERASIFPLGYLSNHELNSFNVSDSMEIANMILEFEAISVALKSNNLASNDIDENLTELIVNIILLMNLQKLRVSRNLLISSTAMLMAMNATQKDWERFFLNLV